MKYEITIGDTTRHVDIEPSGDGHYRVRWEGETHEVDLLRPTPEAYQMIIDGESWEAGAVATADGFLVDVMGLSTEVAVVDPRRRALKLSAGATTGMVATQMPGRVVRLLAKVGDPVRKGQPVIVVEAMKMENEMKSPIDGVVGEILVAEGQAVESGTKLVRVDA
jgi:biotin carboxyl carrier protein